MAADQVQRQIIAELTHAEAAKEVRAYSMSPAQAWPKGPLVVRSVAEDRIQFIGYVNLPIMRHFLFACRLFRVMRSFQPEICIAYNSYPFENVALLVSRSFSRRSFSRRLSLVMVLQDLRILKSAPPLSRAGIKSVIERASIAAVRRFDFIVPVSHLIIEDFNLDPGRCMVFQGGVTDFAAEIARSPLPAKFESIGVFAGALEAYNGLDRLLVRWTSGEPPGVLHVFGRGSLAPLARATASRCSSVVYHGHMPPHEIEKWLLRARWNFCLRYDEGLNQSYFFPSKLFNIVCAPGTPIVNDFVGLPRELRAHLGVVDEDLENLVELLNGTPERPDDAAIRERRALSMRHFSWRACVAQILMRVRSGQED